MARPKGRALERRRAEEAERKAAAAKLASRRRAALMAAGAVLVVAAAIVLVVIQPPPPGLAFPDLGNRHLAALDEPHLVYNSRPPSSGPHLGALAAWGESDVVPPEVFIHNLEDSGVALAYSCGSSCPDLVDGLRQTLQQFEGRNLLLMPYQDIVDPDGVAHRAAAIAWGRVLYFDELDEADAEQLDKFIRTFEGVDHHVRASTPLQG